MPSARAATTAMRPSSPLSPRFEASPRFDSFQQSRQQSYQCRSPGGQSKRRQFGNNLTLPGLPRFHPANYPSAHSSFANTPSSGPNSPHGPCPHGLQQKLCNETQRQTNAYQCDHIARPTSSQYIERPNSPKLEPLGSPGPVTPLELESADGYLSLPKHQPRAAISDHPDEISQNLGQASRQREKLSRAASGPLRPR